MSHLLIRFRYWIFGLTMAFALVCLALMTRVNINTDMTHYLPSDSPMKAGIVLLQEEIGFSTDMAGGAVRVMTNGQLEEEKVDMRYTLHQMEAVNSVNMQEHDSYTLYELSTDPGTDQIALGKEIKKMDKVVAVETPQDGSTADAGMLIGAVSLLLIVLAAMCASWLEPVLFLASTGVAILLNNGTNALLPSVSNTTHSIAAILQLVLSMDYSIILLNRFRQERSLGGNSLEAMTKAIAKAAPSILSSALTTIVGLMMLLFMKLRIGADLGIVLSKGVAFSLLCNFTVLPSLILLFERGIDRTKKKVLNLPTDKLANFSMRHRIPLAIFFIVMLGGSYWLHNQTPIAFLNSAESQIDDYFPKKNPVVLIYDNDDEGRVAELMDSMMVWPGVEMALSYPSLLLREYTVPQMATAIGNMANMAPTDGDAAFSIPMDMLSDDVLKLVYYAAKGDQVRTLGFNQLADFIVAQSKDPHSIIASQMSSDMKQKMAMLDDFREMDNMIQEEQYSDSVAPASIDVVPAADGAAEHDVAVACNTDINERIVNEEAPKGDKKEAQTLHSALPVSPFADTVLIHRQLSWSAMASFLGMDASQAKMVYRLAKKGNETMAPIEFVHFLTDDILKRKALASMISDEQKSMLIDLRHTMDSAHTTIVSSATVLPTENEASAEPAATAAPTHNATHLIEESLASTAQTILEKEDDDAMDDDPLALLDEMMTGNKRYTAREMAINFGAMGQAVDPALMELLYLYYGGSRYYNPQWTMSLKDMISFLGDTVMNDSRFASFITEEMHSGFDSVRAMLDDKLGMMRSKEHSVGVVLTNMSTESDSTYLFIARCHELCQRLLSKPYYMVGESVMLDEMRSGFKREMLFVTLLTIIAIFLIVAISFRSLLIALLLVATVMTGVFVDVSVSAIGGGSLLYMAYLIVQSILMGAAIDYAILFANYYREQRTLHPINIALREAYRGSIHTILTSGLILILVPGAMAILVSDATVASIVRAIAVGALATVLLVLFVLPGLLASCDKWIVKKSR